MPAGLFLSFSSFSGVLLFFFFFPFLLFRKQLRLHGQMVRNRVFVVAFMSVCSALMLHRQMVDQGKPSTEKGGGRTRAVLRYSREREGYHFVHLFFFFPFPLCLPFFFLHRYYSLSTLVLQQLVLCCSIHTHSSLPRSIHSLLFFDLFAIHHTAICIYIYNNDSNSLFTSDNTNAYLPLLSIAPSLINQLLQLSGYIHPHTSPHPYTINFSRVGHV